MAIIKQYHKDTDTTYVYESTSYWDAEKGQSRSKRKCIGKIDSATGEVIPTGVRGRRKSDDTNPSSSSDNAALSKLNEQLNKAKADITVLKAQNTDLSNQVKLLTQENHRLTATVEQIWSLSGKALPANIR